jgi:hypothetical protein
MKILIACEESQTVTEKFRLLGYEAYSCDIQKSSGGMPEYHIINDAITEAYTGNYKLMIAHPPCTFLSAAGARWMYPNGNISQERLKSAMMAKEFFLKLLDAPIPHICIENPTPLKVINLPNYSQVIQPYQFGHEFSKRTLLWLKNLPLLTHSDVKENFTPFLPSNTGAKKRGGQYHYRYLNQRQRSKTFDGIASAMANQWGPFVRQSLI